MILGDLQPNVCHPDLLLTDPKLLSNNDFLKDSVCFLIDVFSELPVQVQT